jgi:hypothetical protein
VQKFSFAKNNANQLKENRTVGELELVQLPSYNIDSLKDESTSLLYKNRLDEKPEEVLKVQKNVTNT